MLQQQKKSAKQQDVAIDLNGAGWSFTRSYQENQGVPQVGVVHDECLSRLEDDFRRINPYWGRFVGHVETVGGTGWRVVAVPSGGLNMNFFHIDILTVRISKRESVREGGHIARSCHSPVVANGGNASLSKGGGGGDDTFLGTFTA